MKFRPLHHSRLAVGLASAALLVSACASSSDSDSPDKKPPPKADTGLVTGLVNVDDSGTPVKGGTLTIAEYSEARSMSPMVSYSNGAAGGSALLAIYDSLMSYDWESQTFVPRMAESLETSDNITWTLKLRDGVKFSDGTPLNADAVIDSIDVYTKAYGYGSVQWLSNVEGMTKVDDSTVEFKTRFPWATFPNMLAHGPGLVMAPAAYKNPKNFKPIGAGPFTFASYAPAENLVLKANNQYWNGRPNLDQLKFVWPGGDEAKYENLQNGDVDGAFLRDDVQVSKLLKDGAPGMHWVLGGGANLWINHREGHAGSMKEVREALQLAWDPVKYIQRLGEDDSLATKSLWPESSPWYTGTEGVPQDVEKAKEKLTEAKAKGFDGNIDLIHFADPSSQKGAVGLQAQLEAAGFKVTLHPMKSVADQMQVLYQTHDFDLAFSALSMSDEDPYLRLAGVTSPTSPTNTAGYDNPEMSKLVTELAAAKGPEDGKVTMKKIEELWQSDAPALNTSTGISFGTWTKNVHGIVPTTETMLFYDKAWKQ